MTPPRPPSRDYMLPAPPPPAPDYMRASGAGAVNGNGASPDGDGAASAANGSYSNGETSPYGLAAQLPPVRTPRAAYVALGAPPPTAPSIAAPSIAPSAADERGAPPPRRATGRGRPTLRQAFVSFEQRDFRYLGLSTVAVGFGQWAQQLGLPLLTLELTGSATQLGLLAFFRGIVGTVTAPIGGVLADRYPRRGVIVASTALSMVQASVLAVLIVTGVIEMWHVYAFAFTGGIIQSLTQPARQAFVYDVSTDETLQNAIVMNSFVQNLSRITAPPLVGAMTIWGIGVPFIFMAATQVVAMAFTLLISKQTRQGALSRTSAGSQVIEGFRATWEDRRILGLVVVHAIPALFILPYLPFIAIVSRDVLGQGATGYGLMISMVGWGSIIGMFALALIGDTPRKGWLMLVGFLGYSSFLVLFSFSTSFLLSLAALGIAGIFFSIAQALNNTLLQVASRNETRGRVTAVWQMAGGLQPLGALPMGFLISAYGPQIGIGSFMLTATIAFLLFTIVWSSVRKL